MLSKEAQTILEEQLCEEVPDHSAAVIGMSDLIDRLVEQNAKYREALEWIATTNACDYEYVQHASAALAGKETT